MRLQASKLAVSGALHGVALQAEPHRAKSSAPMSGPARRDATKSSCIAPVSDSGMLVCGQARAARPKYIRAALSHSACCSWIGMGAGAGSTCSEIRQEIGCIVLPSEMHSTVISVGKSTWGSGKQAGSGNG